jgi:hypothetical protein
MTDDIRHYTAADGPAMVAAGVPHLKKPSPVYLIRQTTPFTVATNEGLMSGKVGDYLAHDPKSGHVWPVAADYVLMHYQPISHRLADRSFDTAYELRWVRTAVSGGPDGG